MKILCVSHTASLTGAPKVIFQIAKRLAASHEVSIVTKEGGSLLDNILNDNSHQITCTDVKSSYGIRKLSLEEKVKEAKQFLAKSKPDLVYANSVESSEWVIAARLLQIKNIFHLHEMKDGLNSALRTRCVSLDVMSYVDLLVCVSKDVERDVYEVFPVKPLRSIVLENFFECDEIVQMAQLKQPMPKNAVGKELQLGKPIVCGCGVASHRKGVDIFFDVARHLPHVQFLWIGQWKVEPKNPVEQDFIESKLDNFFITNEVSNPYFYINLSNLMVLPSREDPNPLVVFESLILGKQVVCFTGTGGSRFVLDRWGYTFSGKPNAKALTSIISRLFSSGNLAYSPNWLFEVVNQVRQEYDFKFSFQKIEELIEDVMMSKPTDTPSTGSSSFISCSDNESKNKLLLQDFKIYPQTESERLKEPKKMRKILVISPSGEIHNHNCVRWFDYQNVQQDINSYHNIGDAFVFDSSLKLLDFDEIQTLNIRNPSSAEIDYYNSEFDYCFLRGSNYIHSEMDWENAAFVLDKLKIPVLSFGIGAQAPAQGPLILSEATKKILAILSHKAVSLGVRGAYTSQVLKGLGIENTRIVGCPTMFRNRDLSLRIDLPPLETIRKVGFTIRREVSKAYAKDVQKYLIQHRQIIVDLAQKFDVQLMAQGEIEEKKIVLGTPEQKNQALKDLKEQDWFREWYLNETILDLYNKNLFYSDVVADYEQLVREKDLVLGFRLHGNLMALSNRKPSIYLTYDSRTVEFADTFKIPFYDVFSSKSFALEDYWDQSLFDTFNATYKQRYQDMKLFLEENSIPHRM